MSRVFSPEERTAITYSIVRWLDIAIKELQKSIINHGIARNKLYRSFTYKLVYGPSGIPSEVSIGFLFHGRFVDMGVTKGVKLEDIKTNAEVWRGLSRKDKKHSNRPRKRKPWYSRTIYREFAILARILQEQYGIGISNLMEDQMNDLTIKLGL